jgi:hypothetical protein
MEAFTGLRGNFSEVGFPKMSHDHLAASSAFYSSKARAMAVASS